MRKCAAGVEATRQSFYIGLPAEQINILCDGYGRRRRLIVSRPEGECLSSHQHHIGTSELKNALQHLRRNAGFFARSHGRVIFPAPEISISSSTPRWKETST